MYARGRVHLSGVYKGPCAPLCLRLSSDKTCSGSLRHEIIVDHPQVPSWQPTEVRSDPLHSALEPERAWFPYPVVSEFHVPLLSLLG